jgi:hypothetical protein
MASDITIIAPAFAPVRFPERCCYCLAPATTTLPLRVFLSRVRVSRTRTTSIKDRLPLPYCDAHGSLARRLNGYDRVATVVLLALAGALLIGFDLSAGRALREIGGFAWFSALLLAMALLAFGAVVLYTGGRLLLSRREPAIRDHSYRGLLGVRAAFQVARRPTVEWEQPLLAITLTLQNDEFAAQTAALHGVEARPAADL